MDGQTDQATTIDAEVQRVISAARDALTDEMIARMASTAGDDIDLMDQVNRAGLARALPALTRMITNGDVDRLSQLARVYSASEDALTDEMVGRLASATSEGLELIDQVNRAGLARAIPALAQLVHSGDLERMVQLARLYGSAQDALTDEMVGRIADTVGSGLLLVDRFNRGGAEPLLQVLEHLHASGALERIARALPLLLQRLDQVERMLHCVEQAARAVEQAPQPSGGFGALWSMVTDADNQASLRFLMQLGRELRSAASRGV